ncbi:MAG: hypothetical protein ACJ8AI_22890 [Rhodopila sp.]
MPSLATTIPLSACFTAAFTKSGRCAWGPPLEDRPRYTPSTTFETFPFPAGLTPNIPAAEHAAHPRAERIAAAARALVEAHDRWLNPPELVDRVPEVVPGFPDRLVPKNAAAAAILKKRTLTALYNTRGTPEGTWLDALHRARRSCRRLWLVGGHHHRRRPGAAARPEPQPGHR